MKKIQTGMVRQGDDVPLKPGDRDRSPIPAELRSPVG
jgi:hypothetical protein